MTQEAAKSLKAVIVEDLTSKVPFLKFLSVHVNGRPPDYPSDLYIPDTFNTSTDINGENYALYCHHPTGYFKCSDMLRNSTKIMVG